MNHVAHQTICMQYILELSKQLDVDPRACVGAFTSRSVLRVYYYLTNVSYINCISVLLIQLIFGQSVRDIADLSTVDIYTIHYRDERQVKQDNNNCLVA